MIEFLSLVTQLSKDDFDDIRIENSEYIPLFYNEKAGRLDIKIRLFVMRIIYVKSQKLCRELPLLTEIIKMF